MYWIVLRVLNLKRCGIDFINLPGFQDKHTNAYSLATERPQAVVYCIVLPLESQERPNLTQPDLKFRAAVFWLPEVNKGTLEPSWPQSTVESPLYLAQLPPGQ